MNSSSCSARQEPPADALLGDESVGRSGWEEPSTARYPTFSGCR